MSEGVTQNICTHSTPVKHWLSCVFSFSRAPERGGEGRGRGVDGKQTVSNQWQHCLISLVIIQMRLICFPTSAPSLRVKRFTSPTASKRDLYQTPPHRNPLCAELQLNGPQVPNNKLMNTGVVFYFSLPGSILFTVIEEMKSTWKGGLLDHLHASSA